jgi:hypothetical protein
LKIAEQLDLGKQRADGVVQPLVARDEISAAVQSKNQREARADK